MNYVEPELEVINFHDTNIFTASPLIEEVTGGSGGTGGIDDDGSIDLDEFN